MKFASPVLYETLRVAALCLPEVYEQPCHGTPAFYAGKKLVVRLTEDGETIALYNNNRDGWMARDGDVFFITDHYKAYPMLLVDLKRVSKEDLKELL